MSSGGSGYRTAFISPALRCAAADRSHSLLRQRPGLDVVVEAPRPRVGPVELTGETGIANRAGHKDVGNVVMDDLLNLLV